eukprot:XP_013967563.1 melanoma-associated antigen 10-like [Canis lupus familiaris]
MEERDGAIWRRRARQAWHIRVPESLGPGVAGADAEGGGEGPGLRGRDFKNWQRRPRSEVGVPQDTELRRCGPEPLVEVQPESDTMPLGKSSKLWKQGEDLEEAQGLVDAQLGPGEAGDEEPLVEGSFHMKTAALVVFLLLKYCTKEPTSKAEMLEVFTPEYQDDFPTILSQASICLRLAFGLDVIEVDPREHSYVLNPILGLTWDGMLSGQTDVSLMWEALGFMGVYGGQEHIVYGEPRDLLTNVWVQEGYLERRQVAGSDPARNEFLWGPRASEETSKLQVMNYMLQIGSNNLGSSLVL